MEEAVNTLTAGTNLWKVRGVSKRFQRFYKIDLKSMCLVGESRKWWSPGNITGNEGQENAISLLDILEVRSGWKTDTFNKINAHLERMKTTTTTTTTTTTESANNEEEDIYSEDKCFSIIYGEKDVLDLTSETKEEREIWVSGLNYLVETAKTHHQEKLYDLWLRKKFEEADRDNNLSLNFEECCLLLKQLNIKMDKINARKLFNAANTNKQKRDGDQVLEVNEFVTFYHSLLKMPEIEKLFKRYANEKTQLMSSEQLLNFLQVEQKFDNYSIEDASKLLREFEVSDLKKQGMMTQDGFYHLLLSDIFDVYSCVDYKTINQDMTQPLTNYYISSSHNTYLTGNQLSGESSVEGYIRALKRGCKFLELDVWDGSGSSSGSSSGGPIIYHGHTLTSKITLEDVLRDAIKIYSFSVSPYPVILTIENHLSLDQQAVMVSMMEDILGDLLLKDVDCKNMTSLPSPEDLKYKIIVRGKKPQGFEIESDDEEDEDSLDYIDSEDGSSQSKKKPHKPLAPELSRVINVLEGRKFISLQDSFENYACYHTPSLGETKAKGLFDSHPDQLSKFTQRNVVKVYPLGTRTDSSNLKPYPFWSVGCQIVALNMQTEDKPNFYNQALFRGNGGCGYVLKPDILLGKVPYTPSTAGQRPVKRVKVVVLSGQHIPNTVKNSDIVDPYVQLKVRGHPIDHQKQRTRVVKNNGFNPVWNEELVVDIRVPEVSLLYFSLRDENSLATDPVLALCCIPFRSLTTGYRHVHLTDLRGKVLSPSALFVHVCVC